MGRKYNEEQRREIVRTAIVLFKKDGYSAVTTRQIADACSMNRSLLYHYYPQKEDIGTTIVCTTMDCGIQFLKPRISITYPELGFSLYFHRLIFGAMEKTGILENIYMEICSEPNVVINIIQHLMKSYREVAGTQFLSYNSEYVKKVNIGIYTIIGTINQLFQCRRYGLIDLSNDDIIIFALKNYFLYMDEMFDVSKMVEHSKTMITDALISEFINDLAAKNGWNI